MEYDAIYPTINESPAAVGQNFRLHKVSTILGRLETELQHYEKVRKKYTRARSLFHGVSVASGTLSGILTASGIGTSLTGPGIVVGAPLSAVGGIFGVVSAGCIIAVKKLTKKISKHEKTIQLIQSKENSISDMVSNALQNDKIDEKEFEHIMTELKKYEALKNKIRSRNNNKLKNDAPDIQKMREQIEKEIINRLINPKK